MIKAKTLNDGLGWVTDFFNLEETTRGCDGQLARTEQLIDGPEFSKSLIQVISVARQKLAP
jgi:hypothetical protein